MRMELITYTQIRYNYQAVLQETHGYLVGNQPTL
jgi:hypothetical protein